MPKHISYERSRLLDSRDADYEVGSVEAIKIINKNVALGGVKFRVWSRPLLPTADGMCFEGCALVSISAAEAKEYVIHVLKILEARGAKIKLRENGALLIIG